ncbi:MAG: hypothetical protein PHQ19_08125 [Candidatus Krumholzibacteria bacterium]|nr:hypothetical protein [Candidatus Krumholzibacteria bacterium]
MKAFNGNRIRYHVLNSLMLIHLLLQTGCTAERVVPPHSDTTPPEAITDLRTIDPTINSISLTWTAPGDNEELGRASEYDIRLSTSRIDLTNWDTQAIQCTNMPIPGDHGSTEIFIHFSSTI